VTAPLEGTSIPDAGRTASGIVVRSATGDDVMVLVDLRAVMFEAMGTPAAALSEAGWREAAQRWFADALGDPEVRIVVAEAGGRPVCGAVGEVTHLIPGPSTPNGSVGLISNVATLAPWRGRGLAAASTDDLLRWFLQDTDVTRVDLFATDAGARIYTQRGFRRREFPAMSRAVDRR
jgi:GNAT superfamily N-acetyltransferase